MHNVLARAGVGPRKLGIERLWDLQVGQTNPAEIERKQ